MAGRSARCQREMPDYPEYYVLQGVDSGARQPRLIPALPPTRVSEQKQVTSPLWASVFRICKVGRRIVPAIYRCLGLLEFYR